MNHSPAEILRKLFIDLGLGTSASAWPVYVGTMPESPDNCIQISDTEPVESRRNQVTGDTAFVYGVQIMVRASTFPLLRGKAMAVNEAMDRDVLRTSVMLDGIGYVVQAVSSGFGIPLGAEGVSKRQLRSINARMVVYQNT